MEPSKGQMRGAVPVGPWRGSMPQPLEAHFLGVLPCPHPRFPAVQSAFGRGARRIHTNKNFQGVGVPEVPPFGM